MKYHSKKIITMRSNYYVYTLTEKYSPLIVGKALLNFIRFNEKNMDLKKMNKKDISVRRAQQLHMPLLFHFLVR